MAYLSTPPELKAQIKAAISLKDVFEGLGVALTPSGVTGQRYTGCCPFHNDTSPSFSVLDDEHYFYCFACKASGDVFSLFQSQYGFDWAGAVEYAAEQANIDLTPYRRAGRDTNEPGQSYAEKTAMRAALTDAATFYRDWFTRLEDDHVAVTMVTRRGLARTQDGVWYGYAPPGRTGLYEHLTQLGHTKQALLDAGLCRESGSGRVTDVFHHRLMFLLTDPSGHPVGFSARQLDPSERLGKYINTAATALFDKKRVLYNQHGAFRPAVDAKTVYVVEGQFDVSAMLAAGLPNTVAASGTAFTKDHAARTLRMVDHDGPVVFCFDGDDAGVDATLKLFVTARDLHIHGRVVVFPQGQDPCDYYQAHGPDGLADYVRDHRVDLWQFVIDHGCAKYDLPQPAQVAACLQGVARYVAAITDPTIRWAATQRLALHTAQTLSTVMDAVNQATPISVGDLDALLTPPPTRPSEAAAPEENDPGSAVVSAMRDDPNRKLIGVLLSVLALPACTRHDVDRTRGMVGDHWAWFLDGLADAKASGQPVVPELTPYPEMAETITRYALSISHTYPDAKTVREHWEQLTAHLATTLKAQAEAQQATTVLRLLDDPNAGAAYYADVLEKHTPSPPVQPAGIPADK